MPFPSGCFNMLWSYMPRSIQSTVLANVWTFTHGNWNKVSKQTYEEDLHVCALNVFSNVHNINQKYSSQPQLNWKFFLNRDGFLLPILKFGLCAGIPNSSRATKLHFCQAQSTVVYKRLQCLQHNLPSTIPVQFELFAFPSPHGPAADRMDWNLISWLNCEQTHMRHLQCRHLTRNANASLMIPTSWIKPAYLNHSSIYKSKRWCIERLQVASNLWHFLMLPCSAPPSGPRIRVSALKLTIQSNTRDTQISATSQVTSFLQRHP